MRRGSLLVVLVAAWAFAIVWQSVLAQTVPPELGQGWGPEFTLTSRQLLQLADATPGDKFGWRPAPGVRSISEVYMHLAAGNLWLLQQAGTTPPYREAAQGSREERQRQGRCDRVAAHVAGGGAEGVSIG